MGDQVRLWSQNSQPQAADRTFSGHPRPQQPDLGQIPGKTGLNRAGWVYWGTESLIQVNAQASG